MSVFCFFKKIVCLIFLLLLIVVPVSAEQISSPQVIVNLPSRTLQLYSGTALIKEYPVAIGKPSTPTPLGSYTITSKEKNPTWIPPGRGYVVESGPDNPLGYRWMEFLPLYGIHGTNAPWTIGMAVSNGCIRMKEEDAEELFEVVKYGTSVKITYERIKINVDSQGQASIGIFSDLYGYQNLSLANVDDKLAEYGFKGFVSETVLLSMLRGETGKQVPFAKVHTLRVNDKTLREKAITVGDTTYVPAWAVAVACNSNIVWDEQKQLIWKGKRGINGVIKGDIIYSKVEEISSLFGLESVFKEDNSLELKG